MTSDKEFFTYKRKRFRSQTKLADDIKVDAILDPVSLGLLAKDDDSNKNLKQIDMHCFKCSTVDVNQNVLVCDGCSGSYHLQCIDSSSKFILEGQWQCLACGKRCIFEEPMQIDSNTKYNNIEELGTSLLQLSSIESFQDTRLSGEIAQIYRPSKPAESTCILEENKIPDNAGNKSSINQPPKGNISFLTFTRRVKKKKAAVKESSEKISNQIPFVDQCRNQSRHSKKVSDLLVVSDDSLVKAEHSPVNELQPKYVEQIIDRSYNSEEANAECSHNGKCAAGILEGSPCKCSVTIDNSNVLLQSHAPSQPTELELRGLSPSAMLSGNDSVTAAALVHQSKQSAMANIEACIKPEQGNKLAEGRTLGFLLDSRSSLTGNNIQRLLDNKAGGLNGKMKSAETFDHALLDRDKRASSNWVEQIGVHNGQSANARASNLLLLSSSIQSQDKSTDCMNLVSFRSDISISEKQQPEEVSTASFPNRHFLGLSLPLNVEGSQAYLKQFRSTLLSSDFSANSIPRPCERQIKLRGFGENSAMPKNKQILDVLTDTQMFKPSRINLIHKYKVVSPVWSDEELDSLWVGVRRHGLNNWNAIIRDPKLACLKFRASEELAEQWDREEIKLFYDTRSQPIRRPNQNVSTRSSLNDVCMSKPSEIYQYGFNPAWSSYSTVQTPRPETRLSLGNLFNQGESSKRQTPYIYGQPLFSSKMPSAGSFDSGVLVSSNSMEEVVNHKDTKFLTNRYDCELSSAFKKSVERIAPDLPSSANSSLPHWLKDVTMSPRTNSPVTLGVPNIQDNNAFTDEQNDAFANPTEASAQAKSLRLKGMLKPRGVSGSVKHSKNNYTSVMTNDHLTDSVVIGASSEETISDH